MSNMKYVVEVEKAKEASGGRPSIGPVYRSLFAKDGFPAPIPGMESCWDVFRMAVERNPNNRMLGQREIVDGKAGKYVWKTYKEVYDLVIKVVNAIRTCGVEERGKCGIYGVNCPEWIIGMEACNALGLHCVPLYDTLGAGAVEFIICHSGVSIAFVEEKKIPEGENKQFDLPVKKKNDICTIMYTSGTTGDPKGVMVSNENIVTFIAGVKCLLESVNEKLTSEDVYVSYLPLAHIFDRAIEEVFISNGAAIGFWRGDVKLLLEDIGELKPTIFCAVPRVLDRIYSGLNQKISSGGLLKKTLFNIAYSYKFHNLKKGHKHVEASPIADKIVFDKVKQSFGGRVRLILSGAAPLTPHVETFLRVVACAHVLQGYGLTETCAGTFVSLPNEMSMIGTVGPPVPNVDVCLESVPEMEYDALSSTPRGEVCVKGSTVFSGYYKREDLTKEVMVDGWFHTGDIGEWQPDGSLKIIDRKKNIFKLSQGEYVAVENLENIYALVSAIDSVWVYGNSFESFLVAIVNPNKDALERWAAENGVNGDFKSLCENPKAKEFILGELSRVAKEKKLKGFEFIKAVHLEPVPFDIERDLLTPTYKKKRPQLLKHYQLNFQKLVKIMVVNGLIQSLLLLRDSVRVES
ncbi:Long chain acyl-CoA synthetase 4 [Citrus sinensis]|nr:Long chain acyl-CoA synthetase 4 [Citrus sinensis]